MIFNMPYQMQQGTQDLTIPLSFFYLLKVKKNCVLIIILWFLKHILHYPDSFLFYATAYFIHTYLNSIRSEILHMKFGFLRLNLQQGP